MGMSALEMEQKKVRGSGKVTGRKLGLLWEVGMGLLLVSDLEADSAGRWGEVTDVVWGELSELVWGMPKESELVEKRERVMEGEWELGWGQRWEGLKEGLLGTMWGDGMVLVWECWWDVEKVKRKEVLWEWVKVSW